MKQAFFEGWYFKQQGKNGVLSLIVAQHGDENGNQSASLQVITGESSYCISYDSKDFEIDRERLIIRLGKNVFTRQGCRLDVQKNGFSLKGTLRFSHLTPPAYDIMGPFCCVPFLQCRHSVQSMRHRVDGRILLNQKEYRFYNADGYWEGDRGVSFPPKYLWTQCCSGIYSIMLSAAKILCGPISFTGCIGFICVNGKEQRIATYLGAKVILVSKTLTVVRQGNLIFSVELLREKAHPLLAPVSGLMQRRIREGVECRVRYRLFQNGIKIIDLISDQAGFEAVL